ncbi:putative reverse transcriptase domain-containing protein, partial [Tanacetum coccineum]
TQVTNNVNNANGGNGRNGGNGGNSRNNGCTYKGFMACNPKEYDGKGGAIALTRWIEKMENVIDNSRCAENQRVKYAASSFVNKALTWWNTQVQAKGHEAAIGYTNRFHELAKLVPHLVTLESSRIKRAGILTNEAVKCGTLTKGNEKRKGVEESSKQGGERNDDKRAKVSKGFMATTTHRNEYTGPHPKCAKCWTYHLKGRPYRVCFNCQKPDHIARNCRMPIKQVALINECGSCEHYQNTCPKLNLAPVGALKDPNVVTGTFSLNHHYTTVLFNFRANFSFISIDFAPLINVKPSFVNPGYVIEVANGKKVEVDRVIHNCKLELGTSLFTIDLIPLGHGSFDVIVGMDWLSRHKAEIVCHEKVVRTPLESVSKGLVGIATATISVVWHILSSRSDASCKVSISSSALRDARIVCATSRVARQGFHKTKSFSVGRLCLFVRRRMGALDGYHQLRVHEDDIPKTAFRMRLVLEVVKKENGIHVDPSKIVAYCSKPLTSLTQKNKKYEWGVEQEEAFQILKDNLCNAPILSLPDGVEDFVLKNHEKNYTTHNLELGAAVFAFKTWRHYLYVLDQQVSTRIAKLAIPHLWMACASFTKDLVQNPIRGLIEGDDEQGVTKQIIDVVHKGLALRVVLVDLHSKDESGKGFKLEVN